MQATQILRQAVTEQPDRVGTIFGERRRTWREIGARVPRLAGALRALGVGTGDCVSILAMNCDRYVETFFAVPWCGGVLAPLNIRWSVAENVFALKDCGARVLLVDDAFAADAARLVAEVGPHLQVIHLGEAATPDDQLAYESLVEQHAPIPDAGRHGEDPYVILYTSGTTLRSKGVVLSHRAVVYVSVCFLATLPERENLVHLHVGGLFHLAGCGPLWYITMSGGTHVLLPKFEPEPVMKAIARHGVTNAVLVPTMINVLLQHPELPRHDLTGFRTCVYGGSPMPEAILQAAMRDLPTWGFHQVYGMTETAGYGVSLRAQDHRDAVAHHPQRLRAAGRPVAGMQIRIARPDGSECAVGETGEILFRGANVMSGYFKNEEATRESLRDGWMHSGDAGIVDEDGFVYVVDRIKDMIVSGGENVYSVDVERALFQHPAVREAAVVGIPSEQWGEAVHAVVVLKDGADVTAEALIAHCRGLIGGYKCPRSVEFRTEPLPLTPVGKVRKNLLRDPHWVGKARKI